MTATNIPDMLDAQERENIEQAKGDSRFVMQWTRVAQMRADDWIVDVWDADLQVPRLLVEIRRPDETLSLHDAIDWLGNLTQYDRLGIVE